MDISVHHFGISWTYQSIRRVRNMTDTIIFDFDGTIAVGDGPIRAFARALADQLHDSTKEGFLAAVFADLDTADAEGFSIEDRDGYGLVNRHARVAGADADALDAAYHQSRSVLASDEAPISAPDGLREFLDSLPAGVRAVLVTNAPDTNIEFALEQLDLAGCFHEIHHSARKPDGLEAIAAPWLSEGRVLSIGDIWINDLMPIEKLGGTTALIGEPAAGTRPDYAAPTLGAMLPALAAWAAESHATALAAPNSH